MSANPTKQAFFQIIVKPIGEDEFDKNPVICATMIYDSHFMGRKELGQS